MIKKLIEKIFKRKELLKIKREVSFLKEEVNDATKILEGRARIISLLITGDSIKLTQRERSMIQWALEIKSFREIMELPQTKAHLRTTWRLLREKIKLSLKEEDKGGC